MKYKVIVNGTEALCDKVTIDGFDYYVSDDLIYNGSWIISDKSVAPIFLDGGDLHVDMLDLTQWKIVIATNNPNIDIPKVVDEVEVLANAYCKEMDRIGEFHDFHSFKYAYNKSQETHPYSEEDMSKFAEWITVNNFLQCADKLWSSNLMEYSGCLYTTEELLELWKSQRTITIHTV